MEAANAAGDTRKIFAITNHLSKKAKQPPSNLTSDKDGNLLKSPEETAATWFKFLKAKFAATAAESKREPLEELPSERTPADALTREEFDRALRRLSDGKAVGPNGVPIEAYKYCPLLRDELFKLIEQIWTDEVVPANLAMAKFIMLFKQKDSPNNPKK